VEAIWFSLIGLLVVTMLVIGFVVPSTRRRRGGDAGTGAATKTLPRPADYVPGVGDDASVPRDTPTRTIDDVTLPERDALVEPAVEVPESPAGRLTRLRARLAGSQSTFGRALLTVLSRDKVDDQTWEDLEDTLISADLGVETSRELVGRLREQARVGGASSPEQLTGLLRTELLGVMGTDTDRSLNLVGGDGHPAVVLVVGVNGTGKTTTTGKLARLLVAEDKDVILGAADTFRAAAADQLQTWGEVVGVPVVRGPEGADPGSVAFEAVAAGVSGEYDVVLVDTAGRLHTKTGLMDELGKVKRVAEKQAPVTEVLLVLDATTGQNGLTQARVFAEVVDVTGIALTKLDGTAKGGIVVAVQRELGVPVKLVGLGEGKDDLAPFDAAVFVDALLGSPAG
jgi:fused signal recognition particle receptor